MNRFTRALAGGGAAVLLTGTVMLGTAGAAAATPGLSCDQLQSRYNSALLRADTYQRLGDHYAELGSYWQAEPYFEASREQWIVAMNIELC